MIRLNEVSFSYENKQIIENLSLSIKKGEKIGIMGESGCGKSTLLRLLAGLYRADKGTIIVDGETTAANYINPVPAGLVLTGIVVSVSVTAFLLALTVRLQKRYHTLELDEMIRLARAEEEK